MRSPDRAQFFPFYVFQLVLNRVNFDDSDVASDALATFLRANDIPTSQKNTLSKLKRNYAKRRPFLYGLSHKYLAFTDFVPNWPMNRGDDDVSSGSEENSKETLFQALLREYPK